MTNLGVFMNEIFVLKFLQVLMVFSALFELYVAYVSPTIRDTILFVLFSFVCVTAVLMLRRRIGKLIKIRN